MIDRTEVLLRFYEEHALQARQHEMQRERVTFLFLFISAAGFGLIAEYPEENAALVAAIGIVVLGVVGCLLSLKHYERNQYHCKIMKCARDEIDSELDLATAEQRSEPAAPSVRLNLSGIQAQAERLHCCERRFFAWLHRRRLYKYWAGILALIALIGLVSVMLLLQRRGLMP